MEKEAKTIGIVAYITFIGFIIALIMNNNKSGETKSFGAFHLRQSLGLLIVSLGISIIQSMIVTSPPTLTGFSSITSIIIFVFMILGIMNASKGERKELPLIGEYIEKTFKNTFE